MISESVTSHFLHLGKNQNPNKNKNSSRELVLECFEYNSINLLGMY
jgi:hypothetical protein